MFALVGYLLCRNLKPALSVARWRREAAVGLTAALRGVDGGEGFWRPMESVPRRVASTGVQMLDGGGSYFRTD
jgi:hypothetical protein